LAGGGGAFPPPPYRGNFFDPKEDDTMPYYEAWVGGGPPPKPTTPANPYAANPTAIPADCTRLVPRLPTPPQTGIDALESVKKALQAGAKPG
jgi:hypothetical protein